mgnify:CR=1 FL=1
MLLLLYRRRDSISIRRKRRITDRLSYLQPGTIVSLQSTIYIRFLRSLFNRYDSKNASGYGKQKNQDP